MIKGIIFDLDDTLYPFQEYLESGFWEVARYAGGKYGIDPQESFAYMKILYSRYGEREVLSNLVSYFSLEPSAIIEMISVFREHRPNIALYPAYRKTLQTLGDTYVLGLLTDGDPGVQDKKIKSLRIQKYFKHTIFTHKFEEAKWKPNAFCFTLMARVIGCNPRDLVFVGDNPLTDFLGAKKAGYLTVRVLTGEFRDKAVPMEFEAHRRIKDLTELQDYMNEFFQ
ncbi:MAG TPA: HAD-IA family hydrolase [Acidobacteriota bacterium]|nr:HAD-IA family hydrolase [Acidobacteriota bacterium]HQF88785.1 HAD-IA family hydrolase [Acidobacteriota bacterium]HQG91190.1 HAD-IA family hydrolase [Acidobacteriota bacterium]HQK87290.1 HAD-IA family hydrolase [Acidobacteriota bacterium]